MTQEERQRSFVLEAKRKKVFEIWEWSAVSNFTDYPSDNWPIALA